MKYLDNLCENKNVPQVLLVILFIIYLVLGYQMPEPVANLIDTMPGKIVVTLVALFMFAYTNPILGVLSLLVAYHMITSASIKTGMASLKEYYPTEDKKWSPFTPTHQFPYTLEQEMVKKMTPQKANTNYVAATYKPVLEDTYDAEKVNK